MKTPSKKQIAAILKSVDSSEEFTDFLRDIYYVGGTLDITRDKVILAVSKSLTETYSLCKTFDISYEDIEKFMKGKNGKD